MNHQGPEELTSLKKKYIVFSIGLTSGHKPKLAKHYNANFIKFFPARTVIQNIQFDRQKEIDSIPDALLHRQIELINLKEACVKVSEFINNQLKRTLLSYSDYKKYDRTLVYKYDFDKRVLKMIETLIFEPIFFNIHALKDHQSRLQFSEILIAFLRDKYIYLGQLVIQSPKGEAFILADTQFINEPALYAVTDNMMENYLKNYRFLLDTLQEVRRTIDTP